MSWTPLTSDDSGLWTAEYKIPGFLCRAYAVRLSGGEGLVSTPGTSQVDLPLPFDSLGYLMAPNGFHWMGIPAFRERHPAAKFVCAPGAAKRLAKRGLALEASLEELSAALPANVSFLTPPGTRIGEVWLRAETSEGVAWIVGDAFFNMKRVGKKPHERLLAKFAKSGPGLSLSQIMKWGGLNDRSAFRTWVLDRLGGDQPKILVPLHGEILRGDDVTERLRALVDDRL